jgi:hypothetical protein
MVDLDQKDVEVGTRRNKQRPIQSLTLAVTDAGPGCSDDSHKSFFQ